MAAVPSDAVVLDNDEETDIAGSTNAVNDLYYGAADGVPEEKKEATTSSVEPTTPLMENGNKSSKLYLQLPRLDDDDEDGPSRVTADLLYPRNETPTVTPEAAKPSRDHSLLHLMEPSSAPSVPPLPRPRRDDGSLTSPSSGSAKASFSIDTSASVDVSELGDNVGSPAEVEALAAQQSLPHRALAETLDDDSSNDESSYFNDPNYLPSPKSSHHRFKHESGTPLAASSAREGYGRESDASLSLSDDSDDGISHRVPPPPDNLFTQSGVLSQSVPELYSRAITRMHSVSSLVSHSSHENSDLDVQEELRDVADGQTSGRLSSGVPSGRLSPVLGQHPPSRAGHNFFPSPSSVNPDPSPPTILSGGYRSQMDKFFHPQPHQMTAGEMAEWVAKGNGPSMPFPTQQLQSAENMTSPHSKESPISSKGSMLTYSEDSEHHAPHSTSFTSSVFNDPNASGNHGPPGSLSGQNQGVETNGFDGSQQRSQMPAYLLQDSNQQQQAQFGFQETKKRYSERDAEPEREEGFKVYWQRWIMLFYMSILNLLSDWTCYSVAPIAVLTREAFGRINAEHLVVVFLVANGIATACEPILLNRLGLRRTVLFGALLLMVGSIIKSGGMPPIIQAHLEKGHGEWRVYLGFFLVGLSQPLYQCTPALLSTSWFPERERTMATGVALNSNQVGIGFAFIFGTLLVSTSDDIPGYFALLSIIATITFLGVLIQFDDAPPTPPSETARVIRGTLDVRLPTMSGIFESVRGIGSNLEAQGGRDQSSSKNTPDVPASASTVDQASSDTVEPPSGAPQSKSKSARASGKKDSSGRRRSSRKNRGEAKITRRNSESSPGSASRKRPSPIVWQKSTENDEGFHGLIPPAPANWDKSSRSYNSSSDFTYPAPSPMMPGSTTQQHDDSNSDESSPDEGTDPRMGALPQSFVPMPSGYPYQTIPVHQYPPQHPAGQFQPVRYPPYPHGYYAPEPNQETEAGFQHGNYASYGASSSERENLGSFGIPTYQPGFMPQQQPYWDPRFQQYVYHPNPAHGPPPIQPFSAPYYYDYHHQYPSYPRHYEIPDGVLPPCAPMDAGAEPVVTITPHHLDINIRDDQVLLSIRACLARPGFIHALVAFTTSGIVINTLSTFMDYLVRLNGVGREYTGIVGGSFQFVIMISSLVTGQFTDKTRAYYSIIVGMLVLGAFGLAECGVNLNSDKGTELRWSLIVVAALVGPLQPVSTELGVDVVYPLSENTVLVIQQLFSNLLSALFIPFFKMLKDYQPWGSPVKGESVVLEYTFSFYLLIIIHAAATVFFATFNGRYVRLEHELAKKEVEENQQGRRLQNPHAGFYDEQRPLLAPNV